MEDENKNEEKIFHTAIAKPVSERVAYLQTVCGNNPELLSHIESLLRAYDAQDDFLEAPPWGESITLDSYSLVESPGTVIGRYKLLEKIGEGGMAVVYMAEQEKPIRRKVALKIIKLGMDTKSVIARFEAERQALAIMDHPNIAKVLDAGATETGRPYFVMDLVPGVSITEYCDKNRLSIKGRLNLFISVCSAVQHAHQKGIIHRDVKPSNVMVTQHDGQSVPKVIDFGIAKATNQKLTEKTLFTRYAHIIGTPAYMSPEQAELSDLDIDTRTDIYSLGVLLYELLTGTTPFSEEKLREAGYLQMQKIICEEEPTKPSTKLSTLGEALTDVAKWHSSNPESLPKLLRGDLDWIVMKSLEKDRSRRYDTASAMALDVQRHLDDEPILAHAPGHIYCLQKFLRRHRIQAVGALALLVLMSAMMVVLYMWNQNRRQYAKVKAWSDKSVLSESYEARAKGDPNTALATVEPILNSRHVGSEARLLHAQLVLDLKGPIAAVQELEALLSSEPEEIAGQAHSLLARIYHGSNPAALGTTEECRLKWEHHRQEAVRLLPESADAYLLQAMSAGTVPNALKLLDRALGQDGQNYDSLQERAYLHYINKDYDKMAMDAAKMTVIRPDHASGHSLSAMARRELKLFDDAIKDHNKAVKLAPDEPEFYDQRRRTCLQMGQYENALRDARTCVRLDPNENTYRIHVFFALTALGRYDEARTEYESKMGKTQLQVLAARYVFDSLHAGRAWHPEKRPPVGRHFREMLAAADHYPQWAAKAQRAVTKGFPGDWSPNGNELVYSHGAIGSTGVAILNRQTGKTRLLTIPGRDPVWSPDGQTIAYVRNRQVLPVQNIPETHQGRWGDADPLDEVWLIKADGTEDPSFLVRGVSPQWSRHSNRIFFCPPRTDGKLCSISPDGGDVKTLMLCPSDYDPVISPDERYVACSQLNYVQVRDMTSGKLVAEWLAPLDVMHIWLSWSPDGQALSMGFPVSTHMNVSRGLWIYDLNRKTVSKVLSGACGPSIWSRPELGQIAITRISGILDNEIWTAATDALGPGQTVEEHVQEAIELYSKRIDADPEYARSYVSRAGLYIYQNDEKNAFADLDRYESIVENPNKKAGTYYNLGWRLSHVPQHRVDPATVVKLHHRAHILNPKNPWFLGTLGIAYYRADRWQDAIDAIDQAIEIGGNGPSDYYAFFLAMAYWQLGDRDQAQTWYKRGIASMSRDVINPKGYVVPRYGYYMEAAELMSLKVKLFDRKAPATGRQILPIKVRADSSHFSGAAAHCVDGTGLADSDQDGLLEHSEDPRHMWLSQQGRTEGWLEFDLPEVHELGSMLVWNYNEKDHAQRGIRRADISVWTAESGWQRIHDDFMFNEAEGSFDYDEPIHIQLYGVKAQKLRLDDLINLGDEGYIGLSEVRFFQKRDGDPQSTAKSIKNENGKEG